MAKEDKKEAEEGGKSGGGLLPIINLVLLLLLLGVGGFNTWTLMQMDKPAPVPLAPTADSIIPEADDASEGPPVEMDLDDVTVNLADPNRYLKVKIKLSLRNEESRARVGEKLSEINDLLITLMSGKRFDDISTPLGKYELKEELVHRINKTVGGNPVRKLYFTDFVSQ